jgi:hypothetical protein
MPADEAAVPGGGCGNRALRRADVRHRRLSGGEHGRYQGRQLRDRRRDDDERGAADRLLEGLRRRVGRPALDGDGEAALVRIERDDAPRARPLRSQADRRPDQAGADHGKPVQHD